MKTLAQHMAEWEIHSLRGLITTLLITVRVYSRSHPDAEQLADDLDGLKDIQAGQQVDEWQAHR